jgi:hypothetical protein
VRNVTAYSQELTFPISAVSLDIDYENLNTSSSGTLVTEITSTQVFNIDQLVSLFNADADFNQYGVYSKADRNNKLALTMTDLAKSTLLISGSSLISLNVFAD